MVVHMVLGKPLDDLDEPAQRELASALGSLGSIPGVMELTWGSDFSGRGDGYTFGAVIHLADREALQHYLTHPGHLQVVDVLNRVMPERLVLDYETATSAMST